MKKIHRRDKANQHRNKKPDSKTKQTQTQTNKNNQHHTKQQNTNPIQ